jgi:hypothetical protein
MSNNGVYDWEKQEKRLTVSRHSWHYWLYMHADPYARRKRQPRSLCGYFWTVLLSPITIILGYSYKLVFGAGRKLFGRRLGGPIIVAGWAALWLYLAIHSWYDVLWLSITVAVVLVAVVLVLALAVFLHGWRIRKHWTSRETPMAVLAWETIKAKKRKVCPPIEVK